MNSARASPVPSRCNYQYVRGQLADKYCTSLLYKDTDGCIWHGRQEIVVIHNDGTGYTALMREHSK